MGAVFEPIKPYIGSIVHVSKDEMFTEEVARQCREMLDERTVLVFPRANLTDAEQLAFTDLMGARVDFTTRQKANQTAAEDVYQVTLDKKINRQPEYVLGTFFWHMDGITVDMPPPKASLLSARKVAAKGGQTEFASTAAAYDHLPEAEKAELKGLRAVHSVAASLSPIADAIPEEDRERVTSIGLVKEHPIVWQRESGRTTMVIGTTADTVVGMPVAHGRALLHRLTEWAAQPDFSYRHQWEEGDFVVWDNTAAMHRVIPYDDTGRMMHRTSVAGTEAVS
ncbi:TauD/TfdA family dioxygenase [Sphingomonas naphthae]|uniref:TauD/TfdA family dioxygenase n=1 Tax=Sphingomonas naphthae TaxID=1813468 RepID=A0ABY7TK50_9SPHN|nr:TauD/TfdA family dioxygenase [Sphingomonas naphthae]WCT73608.1 TauD/TfdA family dioxygenase [Sphingomonas naphthae]